MTNKINSTPKNQSWDEEYREYKARLAKSEYRIRKHDYSFSKKLRASFRIAAISLIAAAVSHAIISGSFPETAMFLALSVQLSQVLFIFCISFCLAFIVL